MFETQFSVSCVSEVVFQIMKQILMLSHITPRHSEIQLMRGSAMEEVRKLELPFH